MNIEELIEDAKKCSPTDSQRRLFEMVELLTEALHDHHRRRRALEVAIREALEPKDDHEVAEAVRALIDPATVVIELEGDV